MQQRRLGRSGLQVSRLGLGTLTWGDATDEHEARELLTAFVDAGGTLVDTSASYGGGRAESLLGSLLGDQIRRDEVVIATKAGIDRSGNQRRLDASRGYLLRALDESLRRIGTDYVDLWQVHAWDDDTPIEETLSALDVAVASGRVRYAGISNYCGWQTAQAATWQRAAPGRTPLVCTQVEYSLVNRTIEDEVLPAAKALELGVLPWSPLGRGVLTGKYREGMPSDSRAASDTYARYVGAYLGPEDQRITDAVVRAADGLGWAPLEVALAWVRDRPGVTAPIVGPRTAAQLAEILAVEDRTLPAEIVTALDDVSGGA